MRHTVLSELQGIEPLDALEQTHLLDARSWVNSGAPLCRVAKPSTPPKHLVAYFALVDQSHILLVDHKNAQLWLPPGGHVEPGESPRLTVVRELHEELGVCMALQDVGAPLMVTVTQTVGLTAGHTDVSLWYLVYSARDTAFVFDAGEFNAVRWFAFDDVPLGRCEPHLQRFLAKIARTGGNTRWQQENAH